LIRSLESEHRLSSTSSLNRRRSSNYARARARADDSVKSKHSFLTRSVTRLLNMLNRLVGLC
jgi:hypothetical protein